MRPCHIYYRTSEITLPSVILASKVLSNETWSDINAIYYKQNRYCGDWKVVPRHFVILRK